VVCKLGVYISIKLPVVKAWDSKIETSLDLFPLTVCGEWLDGQYQEERERMCVCVCVCVRERERERACSPLSQRTDLSQFNQACSFRFLQSLFYERHTKGEILRLFRL
jgi:hypothetical protein